MLIGLIEALNAEPWVLANLFSLGVWWFVISEVGNTGRVGGRADGALGRGEMGSGSPGGVSRLSPGSAFAGHRTPTAPQAPHLCPEDTIPDTPAALRTQRCTLRVKSSHKNDPQQQEVP